ncbi:MAG: sigma 54-interacting transcriptional regulator [Paracoccaceae bacterium]|nr:sigma 54-interacting transcriptional regulator [Paracoccaceae bacterium]MDE3122270.1 sigma 54-interacting transcriptional regulator [Paracoccaceae bacterium]MDE3239524.1 sigma 54-interacting transcriptional regulator [Paracoccaceae bacterium]
MAQYNDGLIGQHESIRTLRSLIERVAKSPVRTVLIYGETGTGKGLVARMLHRGSSRAAGEFAEINCAAIPAGLMESELFGHEKGAFTGAVERKIGLIEAADKGTVFLDEIREMELTLQAKLLTLLDTHQFRRVGGVRATSVDVRYIAATNKVLLSEVKAGHFREDLYYRLQVVALNIAPLRDRGEDVLILARHFIDKFNRQYDRRIKGLSDEVAQIFLKYPWPGNVRELENLLERIFILEDDDIVLPSHLPDRILRAVRAGTSTATGGGHADPAQLPAEAGFHPATAAFQKALIQRALNEANNNLQQAAAALKISRHALRHQMLKLGILDA